MHVQDGQTALFLASRNGHAQVAKLLLRREADVSHHTKVRLASLWPKFKAISKRRVVLTMQASALVTSVASQCLDPPLW